MLAFIVIAAAATGAAGLPPAYSKLESLLDDAPRFADALHAMGKLEQARARIAIERGDLLERTGDVTGAEAARGEGQARRTMLRDAYEFAVERFGGDAPLFNHYGELLYDHFGDVNGAIVAWNKAISLDSGLAAPYCNLGVHHCETGQFALGLQYLDRALDLEPRNASYCFNLAQVYLNGREKAADARGWKMDKLYKEMLKLSKRAAELAPDDFEIVQDYAVLHLAAEKFGAKTDWNEAAAAWARTRRLARGLNEWFFTRLNEARVWELAGQNDCGLRCLNEGLRFHPGNASARALLEELKEGGAPDGRAGR